MSAYGHAGAVRLQGERGRVLMHPEPQAGPLETPGEFGGVEHGDAAAVVQAREEGRRVDLLADRVGVQELDAVRQAPLPHSRATRRSSAAWCGSAAMSISPERSKSQSQGVAGDGRLDLVEVAGAQLLQLPTSVRPAGESVGQAVGQDAAQKPPLRPEAAQPTSRPSRSTTSRCGSRSLAISAVHSPL